MSELYNFLKKTTSHLDNVTYRNAYGLDAVFVKDKAFLLITKDNEIALRIEDRDLLTKRRESIDLKGLALHDKSMEHWYLIPTSYNKKKNRLVPLIDSAYLSLFKQRQKKRTNKKKKQNKKVTTNQDNASSKNRNQKVGLLGKIISFFR